MNKPIRLSEAQAREAFARNRFVHEPTDADIAALSALVEVDFPERILGQALRVHGYLCPCPDCRGKVKGARAGWPKKSEPYQLLLTYYRDRGFSTIPFFDHPYTVVRADGDLNFFCEPYDGLGLRDMEALVWLGTQKGFDVSLSVSNARHFPGWTLRVGIRPKKAKP